MGDDKVSCTRFHVPGGIELTSCIRRQVRRFNRRPAFLECLACPEGRPRLTALLGPMPCGKCPHAPHVIESWRIHHVCTDCPTRAEAKRWLASAPHRSGWHNRRQARMRAAMKREKVLVIVRTWD
jgi:hypothetical protein